MDRLGYVLIVAGLVFPILSALTGVASLVARFQGRRASPVFVPLIGPVLLDCGLLVQGRPLWLLAAPWVCDPGTVAFLLAAPRLAREAWETSAFTETGTLLGASGIESVTISLHRTGRYLLEKRWRRAPGEAGVLAIGELGRHVREGTDVVLFSDAGTRRRLRIDADGRYLVDEAGSPGDLSVAGWALELKEARRRSLRS